MENLHPFVRDRNGVGWDIARQHVISIGDEGARPLITYYLLFLVLFQMEAGPNVDESMTRRRSRESSAADRHRNW